MPLRLAVVTCRRRLCNPKMPRLLSYLLGNKVNLVTIRKDQAVGIREEYHAFRNKAVWVMGTMPMLLYLGMKRADHVTEGGQDNITLTPALLTGVPCEHSLQGLCIGHSTIAVAQQGFQLHSNLTQTRPTSELHYQTNAAHTL